MQLRLPVLLLSLPLVQACSWDSARRSGYETLESMRIQQCLERRDDLDCTTERQRYEDYEARHPSDTRH